MPKGTKVARCVSKVDKQPGMTKGDAIATCQKSTGLSYATGKKQKAKPKK